MRKSWASAPLNPETTERTWQQESVLPVAALFYFFSFISVPYFSVGLAGFFLSSFPLLQLNWLWSYLTVMHAFILMAKPNINTVLHTSLLMFSLSVRTYQVGGGKFMTVNCWNGTNWNRYLLYFIFLWNAVVLFSPRENRRVCCLCKKIHYPLFKLTRLHH